MQQFLPFAFIILDLVHALGQDTDSAQIHRLALRGAHRRHDRIDRLGVYADILVSSQLQEIRSQRKVIIVSVSVEQIVSHQCVDILRDPAVRIFLQYLIESTLFIDSFFFGIAKGISVFLTFFHRLMICVRESLYFPDKREGGILIPGVILVALG